MHERLTFYQTLDSRGATGRASGTSPTLAFLAVIS